MGLEISINGEASSPVVVARSADGATVWIDGRGYRAQLRPVGNAYEVEVEDRAEQIWFFVDHDIVHVHAFGRAWQLEVFDPVERSLRAADEDDTIAAPMPGTVISIGVQVGDQVDQGQTLVVIESMKMQSEMVAPRGGVVEEVHLQVGDTFDRGAALVALESEDDEEEED
jgi:biotin carboxyl carrier protein